MRILWTSITTGTCKHSLSFFSAYTPQSNTCEQRLGNSLSLAPQPCPPKVPPLLFPEPGPSASFRPGSADLALPPTPLYISREVREPGRTREKYLLR